MSTACSRPRPARPIPRYLVSTPTDLALEKVIQDHIPTVTGILRCLLSLLTSPDQPPPNTRRSLLCFEHDIQRLCLRAQEGVRKMDLEIRMIESTWDCIDKKRWEVCRADYRAVMTLVQEVFKAGQSRMEVIGVAVAGTASKGRTTIVSRHRCC